MASLAWPLPRARLAVVSLNPLSGKALDTRDMLDLKTDVAMIALDPKEDVLGFVEKVIMDIPEGQEEGIACTPLDFNLCRLKGLYADLQRPEVVGRVGSYDDTSGSWPITSSCLPRTAGITCGKRSATP